MTPFIQTFQKAMLLTAAICCLVSGSFLLAQCPQFDPGFSTGTIQSGDIDEASGLAASRKNPYVLWTHNDKGGSARLFAMNIDGTHLGIYNLFGASNRDWEDIAVGPGPVGGLSYIYVGEIGDNDGVHSSIMVYRVPEPQVDANQSPVELTVTGVETITLQYPDGARDAEALMVDPLTKDIYIISKREEHPRLYRAPYPQSTTQTTIMEYKCELPWQALTYWDWVTAGDISQDGSEVIVRSYDNGSIWQRPADANLWDAFGQTECPVQLLTDFESLGEAVCFVSGFACGYMTTSEGTHSLINYFPRIFKADLDENCHVDFRDFSFLASAWLSAPGDDNWNSDCDISDPNDSFIDANDLAVFVGDWLVDK